MAIPRRSGVQPSKIAVNSGAYGAVAQDSLRSRLTAILLGTGSRLSEGRPGVAAQRDDIGMHDFMPYVIAFTILWGSIALPLTYLIAAGQRTNLTVQRLITDHKVRSAAREALTAATLPLGTFNSIATLAGTAAGATWWLIQAKHSGANPIALAITGEG